MMIADFLEEADSNPGDPDFVDNIWEALIDLSRRSGNLIPGQHCLGCDSNRSSVPCPGGPNVYRRIDPQ